MHIIPFFCFFLRTVTAQHEAAWGMPPCYSLKSFTCPCCGRQRARLLSPHHAATHSSHTSISKPYMNKQMRIKQLDSFIVIFFFSPPLKVQKSALNKELGAGGHSFPCPSPKSVAVSIPCRWLRTLRGRGCCLRDQR